MHRYGCGTNGLKNRTTVIHIHYGCGTNIKHKHELAPCVLAFVYEYWHLLIVYLYWYLLETYHTFYGTHVNQ